MRKTIAVVFGTRPDTIKLAPLILELRKQRKCFRVITIATAQHRQMLDQVLDVFRITPDRDLNIMQPRQTLASITRSSIAKLDRVFAHTRPDLVLVQGDTTTTFVGSLAAFYRDIPVGHVEAGLRTNNKFHPFPEEINRRLTSCLADLHFAPTQAAKNALLRERCDPKSIFLTGNTVIDALKMSVRKTHRFSKPLLNSLATKGNRKLLITMHRRENWGDPMRNATRAIKRIALQYQDCDIIFPVHLNPQVRQAVYAILSGVRNVHLVEPLNYLDFVNLMAISHLIISDSGGIQEEGPSLGKPVLVLREVTERPEAVAHGTAKLVGLSEERIVRETVRLMSDSHAYRVMATATNPYGDGLASRRIVSVVKKYFGFTRTMMKEFRPRD